MNKNHSSGVPSAPPGGDKYPATPPVPSVGSTPHPTVQQPVYVGHSPPPPPPQVVYQQAPSYVYINGAGGAGAVMKSPTPLWLEITLVVSGMLLLLGQYLCIEYAAPLIQSSKPVMNLMPKEYHLVLVGSLLAGAQMISDKVGYQVLYLIGFILVLTFGLVAIYGYQVAGGRRGIGGGALGVELMFSGIITACLEMIAYGIMTRYTSSSGSSMFDSMKRNMIIYMVCVGIAFILFMVGWGICFNKLFSKATSRWIQVLLHVFTCIAGVFGILAPMVVILAKSVKVGYAFTIISMVFTPCIYGVYTWIVYMKEKKLNQRNADFVVDPTRLSMNIEAGRNAEANQPLIVQ